MRKALNDTFLIWVLLGLVLAAHAAIAMGVALPLGGRTTFGRMRDNPWATAAVAGIGAATVLALAYGPGRRERRARVVAVLLVLLGGASLFAFDPALGGTLLFTGGQLYRSVTRGATPVAGAESPVP
jgi:hypothetical protein